MYFVIVSNATTTQHNGLVMDRKATFKSYFLKLLVTVASLESKLHVAIGNSTTSVPVGLAFYRHPAHFFGWIVCLIYTAC